jgi:hypothetical protein
MSLAHFKSNATGSHVELGPNVTDSILMKCVLLQDKIASFFSQMISSSETD